MTERTTKERLARFMDPAAFTTTVPKSVKFTCKQMAKVRHDKLEARRKIALERADASIRFFLKPENLAILNKRAASAIEARRAETGTGSVHESAVAESQTP